jgi:hypothetical protein
MIKAKEQFGELRLRGRIKNCSIKQSSVAHSWGHTWCCEMHPVVRLYFLFSNIFLE